MNSPILEPNGLRRTREIRELVRFQSRKLESAPIFQRTDTDLIRTFGLCFGPELEYLQGAQKTPEPGKDKKGCYGAVVATHPCKHGKPGGAANFSSSEKVQKPGRNGNQHPSELLYGVYYDEVDRTIVGALALKWLVTNDYDAFTCGQPTVHNLKLSKASFQDMRRQVIETVTTPEKLYALFVSMIINDLGKNPGDSTKEYGPGMNHDEIIFRDAKRGKIELLNEFAGHDHGILHEWLLLGLKIGAKLNVPQFAQAENAPGSLSAVKEMKGQSDAFALKLLEIILDVAGAQGHGDASCSKSMIEPTWKSFSTSRTLLFRIVDDTLDESDAYDEMLNKRACLLEESGFDKLEIKIPEQRALLRLLTMGRCLDADDNAKAIKAALASLKSAERKALVNGLSVKGTNDGTAIIPYYAPSLFATVLHKTSGSDQSHRVKALAALLRYLSKVFRNTAPSPEKKSGMLVECRIDSVREILDGTQKVDGKTFVDQPEILDRVDVEIELYSVHPSKWL